MLQKSASKKSILCKLGKSQQKHEKLRMNTSLDHKKLDKIKNQLNDRLSLKSKTPFSFCKSKIFSSKISIVGVIEL